MSNLAVCLVTTIFADTLLFDHGTPKQVLSISFIEISFWAHWDFHTVSVSCLLVNSSSNEIFRGTSYNQYSGGFHLHLYQVYTKMTDIPYAHHYKLWFVYFYPLFEDHSFWYPAALLIFVALYNYFTTFWYGALLKTRAASFACISFELQQNDIWTENIQSFVLRVNLPTYNVINCKMKG